MKRPFFIDNLIYKIKKQTVDFKQLQQKQNKKNYLKFLSDNTIQSFNNLQTKQQQKPYRKYSFYIGSNNDTREVEITKIQQLFNEHFKAFTVKHTLGYYENEPEKSIIVEIYDNEKTLRFIKTFTENLKIDLKQNSVLLVIEKPKVEFI